MQEFVRVFFENNSFLQFFYVLIHCSADCACWLFPQAICPSPKTIGFKTIENNRKISITKEICITIDPQKIPGRKPDSKAGCIFENFTPKQGNSLKTLAAGTRNHGVSLPPGLYSDSHLYQPFIVHDKRIKGLHEAMTLVASCVSEKKQREYPFIYWVSQKSDRVLN